MRGRTLNSKLINKTIMSYKFEIYEDNGGKFRFNFKAPNGEVMFSSQGYTTKSSLKNSIESIQQNVPGADITEAESD